MDELAISIPGVYHLLKTSQHAPKWMQRVSATQIRLWDCSSPSQSPRLKHLLVECTSSVGLMERPSLEP
ncbi:unnamed protein product [Rodentolepis nana]|uniref:Uncharacterized protein n=1 Tax=Rodentolepis nana TaxID=102285 RepID=A0A3P7S4A7_RODNA|nr:unnamed protein product [Rodentolepis nana]